MKTAILAMVVIAVLTVGTVAQACDVHADVKTYFKDEYDVVHIVFAIDASCGRNQGCGGVLNYVVMLGGSGGTKRIERTALWHTSQPGSASVEAEVQALRGEEVATIYLASVTCR